MFGKNMILHLVIIVTVLISYSLSIIIVGHISYPNKETSERDATYLVKNNLVKCAKIFSNVTSIYKYKGILYNENEFYIKIKTVRSKINDIENYLNKNHPYETYEFIYHESYSSKKYENWVNELELLSNNDINTKLYPHPNIEKINEKKDDI